MHGEVKAELAVVITKEDDVRETRFRPQPQPPTL